MNLKLFDNNTGLERGSFTIIEHQIGGFNIADHHTENCTCIESSEPTTEVLVDGSRYVLDCSNEPTITESQIASITGYQTKSGGGYEAVWTVETKGQSDPIPVPE